MMTLLQLAPAGLIIVAAMLASTPSVAQLAPPSLPGSLDTSFNAGAGPDNVVNVIATQPDGKVLIAGSFQRVNDLPVKWFAQLTGEAALDPDFGFQNSPTGGPVGDNILKFDATRVMAIAPQLDGKMILGGNFTAIGTVSRIRIARLNGDGTPDLSFDPGAGPSGGLQHPTSGDLALVAAIALQRDGKILIGGSFSKFGTNEIRNIARLNADGTFDASFQAAPGASGGPSDGLFGDSSEVRAIAVQSDGRILIGGSFAQVNGQPRLNLARFNNDGSLDAEFAADVGVSPGDRVNTVLLQPDGKILIAGAFTKVQQVPNGGIARLDEQGNLDSTFKPELGADGVVHQLALLSDGRILLVGDFAEVSGIPRNRIARLNSDGTVDATFDPNPGVATPGSNGATHIYCVTSDAAGNVLIGGSFTQVANSPRKFLARLFGGLDSVATGLRLSSPSRVNDTFSLTVPTCVGKTYNLEVRSPLSNGTWTSVQAVAGDGTFKALTHSGDAAPQGFYRVRAQ